MKTKPKRTQSRALPWLGSDAMVCDQYAALLADCRHVTVPFCGGLSIVAKLVETGGEIVCNDAHRLAMNFYRAISKTSWREELVEHLERLPFHETVLECAQEFCKRNTAPDCWDDIKPDMAFAAHYFVTAWMGRSGKGGSTGELNGDLPVRWSATGGSSPLRFATAVRSIQDVWGPICERCSFLCRDWSEILAKVKDDSACAIFADPPWVGAGDEYVHKFSEADHRRLAEKLTEFFQTKIVVRYGDHPLIRELYADWNIREITSRNQANGATAELCITNFEPSEA